MERIRSNLAMQRVLAMKADPEAERRKQKEEEQRLKQELERQERILTLQLEEMADKMKETRDTEIKRLRAINKQRMRPLTGGASRPPAVGGSAHEAPSAYLCSFSPNVSYHIAHEKQRLRRPETAAGSSASAAVRSMGNPDADATASPPTDVGVGAGPRSAPTPAPILDDSVVSMDPQVGWSPRRGLYWTAPIGLRPSDSAPGQLMRGGGGRGTVHTPSTKARGVGASTAPRPNRRAASRPSSRPGTGGRRLTPQAAESDDGEEDQSEGESDDDDGSGGIFLTSRLDNIYIQRPPSAPERPKLVSLTPLAASLKPSPEALRPNLATVAAGPLACEDREGFEATLNSMSKTKSEFPTWSKHGPSEKVGCREMLTRSHGVPIAWSPRSLARRPRSHAVLLSACPISSPSPVDAPSLLVHR